MDKWIKISEKLPKENTRILVFINPKYTFANPLYDGFYDAHGFVDYRMNWPLENVTHWMPLPKPPKGEEDEV